MPTEKKEKCNIHIVTHRIRKMTIEQKHKLFALWVAKIREDGSATLNVLFALDDEYNRIYQENRIKYDFKAAQLLGYKQILTIFYGG